MTVQGASRGTTTPDHEASQDSAAADHEAPQVGAPSDRATPQGGVALDHGALAADLTAGFAAPGAGGVPGSKLPTASDGRGTGDVADGARDAGAGPGVGDAPASGDGRDAGGVAGANDSGAGGSATRRSEAGGSEAGGLGAGWSGAGGGPRAGDEATSWWSPAPLLPPEEGSEPENARKPRRGRRTGGRAGGRRGRAASANEGWLPDGPDDGPKAATAPDADPEAVARAICLRLLTMAPKTRAQLAQALRKRDVPEEAAEAVLDRFSELGLINDEAFAEAWVDSRHHGRGLAKRALAAELRHRGVDSDTVNEAVERLDPDQELETARRLVERKLASTRTLDTQTRTRRLAGMLARKGYPPGLAFRVVKEALEQEGLEIDDDFP
ncbi:RecX family transcriptional regulator [Nonomuraea muscovyensis]|uniref:RecX family transcriptional regulator n=1 Tax=Nonomuraea muscovyensis TaxID=1124761 RepID=UPI001608AFA3|nr:RecX family transcriptional regulator [Nonomuraea muscovyensis]